MVTEWRFDANNPYEDSFEQALLKAADSTHVLQMVKRKCIDIQRAPKDNYHGVVRGKFVYIAKTGPVTVGETQIDPLLVVYTLVERERLIQRVFVCRASDVVDNAQLSTMDRIARALHHAIDRALENAPKKRRH